MAQTVTTGEEKVYPESESLKFSAPPSPQVENPSDSDSSDSDSITLVATLFLLLYVLFKICDYCINLKS